MKEEQFVTATSTYMKPTQRELEEDIIEYARELVRRPWWKEKSHLIASIKHKAQDLNDFYPTK